MKKFIPIVFLLFAGFFAKAQNSLLNISTSQKETRYWNPATNKFDDSDGIIDYSSLFTFNDAETMFTHVTQDMKSSYYVDSKKYLDGCSCYSYDVKSDVGNKYTFFLDIDKNALKIMSVGHDNAKDDYLILFTIKKSWRD